MAVHWIAFHITDRCQLNCDHCLRDPQLKAKDVDVALVDRVLAEARRVYDPHEVGLTGGEPTLHPQFYEIVDSTVRHGYQWHMVSNGERFPQVLAELDRDPRRLAAMTSLCFSLDGAEEATHDAIRGKGSYRTVMAAISLAIMRDIPVVLQMTPNRRNVDEVEAFAFLAAQLGAARVMYSALQSTGTLLDWSLYLTFEEHARVAARIRRLDSVLSIPVTADDGYHIDTPFYMCDAMSNRTLHIDPDGNLNLCCRYSGIPAGGDDADAIANLHQVTLAEAHQAMVRTSAETMVARVQALAEGLTSEWDRNPCNHCFKTHGKPHWGERGPAGPQATRARWRGAWAPDAEKQAEAEARRAELTADE